MLSNKVIDYLNKQGVYSEKEDKAYKKALIDLGIDLNSDFALFNLNTTEITFRGQCGEIYNVCWFKIYSNDLSYGIERQAVLGIPSEYLPLDSFEGEGGFFYRRSGTIGSKWFYPRVFRRKDITCRNCCYFTHQQHCFLL